MVIIPYISVVCLEWQTWNRRWWILGGVCHGQRSASPCPSLEWPAAYRRGEELSEEGEKLRRSDARTVADRTSSDGVSTNTTDGQGLLCETKPICPPHRPAGRAAAGASVQNKASWPAWFSSVQIAVAPVRSVPVRALKERVAGAPPSNRGQDARDTTPHGVTTNAPRPRRDHKPTPVPWYLVLNQASCSRAVWRASTLGKKSYDELSLPRASAKQSQLPHGQQWARGGEAAGGTGPAKQSQSAPHRPEEAMSGRTGSAAIAGDKRAKQSQFPGVGWRDGSGTCHCERSAAIRHRMPAAPVPRVCRPCCLTRSAEFGLIPRACWMPSNLNARCAR
jgi:hypothetical protein